MIGFEKNRFGIKLVQNKREIAFFRVDVPIFVGQHYKTRVYISPDIEHEKMLSISMIGSGNGATAPGYPGQKESPRAGGTIGCFAGLPFRGYLEITPPMASWFPYVYTHKEEIPLGRTRISDNRSPL